MAYDFRNKRRQRPNVNGLPIDVVLPDHSGYPPAPSELEQPQLAPPTLGGMEVGQPPPTASMSGKITDSNNVFYTPPQPVREQQPAEYHPNGIRKRAMDERDPSGEPIGGQSSSIERSTWNPEYNPAYDQSRKDYRPQPPDLTQAMTSAYDQPTSAMPPPDASILSGTVREPAPDEQRQQAWGEYQGLLNSRPRKEKAWKEAIFLGLQGLDKVFSERPNPQPIRLLRDVQHDKRLAESQRKVGALEQQAKFEGERAREAAQIDDFGRKKNAEKRIGENQIRDDRNAILKGLYGTGFNSKQPTKAQLLALQSVGLTPEDVGDVRQTNPRTGVVGGVQFEQDAITGEWKDSGRPHDPTEAFVSMQVNDADGNDMGTFTVSQKNKAQFVTQLVSAGYQTKKAEYNEIREIKRRNADRRTKYEQELRDYDAQFKTSQGAIQAAEDALIDLDTAITALNGEIAGTLDEDAKKTLRSNLNTLQTSKRNQQKEIAKLKGTKIARPVKPSYEDENVNMPSNSGMVGSGKTTEAAAREHYKKKGLSPKDIDAAIQRARDAGEVY